MSREVIGDNIPRDFPYTYILFAGESSGIQCQASHLRKIEYQILILVGIH